ncbi:MAG: YaaA family protein [Bacteroidetes Order II. Incertae sedis bacterium]|nr:YaaA family protein [Bacteroidetes Order II. bacterium]
MPGFCVLIPPAEGKASGGLEPNGHPHPFEGGFSCLRPAREALYDRLLTVQKSGVALDKLFGVRGKNLIDAIVANEQLAHGRVLPALDRYAPGIMYRSLDFATLPPEVQTQLLEHTLVFSGLFGLLRIDDLIPMYKLKMDAILGTYGRVSDFWKPFLQPVLQAEMADKTVWDLLPTAHAAAWTDSGGYRYRVQVAFLEEKNGRRKTVSHGVKPLRGELIRYLAIHRLTVPTDLRYWIPEAGFQMDADATQTSSDGKRITLVFVK